MEERIDTMPLIGDKAPAFEAETTQGKIRFPEDYRGKWVILFSHPGDFTPVCTSEFVLFGAMQREFEALNCALIGLSVGTVASHIAWLRSIRERIEFKGHRKVGVMFPLVADLSMSVARKSLAFRRRLPFVLSSLSIRRLSCVPWSIIRCSWGATSTS